MDDKKLFFCELCNYYKMNVKSLSDCVQTGRTRQRRYRSKGKRENGGVFMTHATTLFVFFNLQLEKKINLLHSVFFSLSTKRWKAI